MVKEITSEQVDKVNEYFEGKGYLDMTFGCILGSDYKNRFTNSFITSKVWYNDIDTQERVQMELSDFLIEYNL